MNRSGPRPPERTTAGERERPTAGSAQAKRTSRGSAAECGAGRGSTPDRAGRRGLYCPLRSGGRGLGAAGGGAGGRGRERPLRAQGSQGWKRQCLETAPGDAGASASVGLHRRESLWAGWVSLHPPSVPTRLGVAGPAPSAAASRVSGSLPAPTGLSWLELAQRRPVALEGGHLETLRVPGPVLTFSLGGWPQPVRKKVFRQIMKTAGRF